MHTPSHFVSLSAALFALSGLYPSLLLPFSCRYAFLYSRAIMKLSSGSCQDGQIQLFSLRLALHLQQIP